MFLFRTAFWLVIAMTAMSPLRAQTGEVRYQLENLINQTLVAFPFSRENKLRLAAYAELKGEYSPRYQSLVLNFDGLGSLSIYPRSCVLKTEDHRLYYLSKTKNTPLHTDAFNQKVNELLDRIFLFSNHGAPYEKIDFVDTYLAKKNIEPYEKIFLRHILLKYGRYDARYERVEFHTDWLPARTYLHLSTRTKSIVRKPVNPLWIKLDKQILRGYFIRDKGTVYVEDVDRDVFYASGEEYAPNIAAFKLFLYKMLTQTTQFVISKEKNRLEEKLIIEDLYSSNVPLSSNLGSSRGGMADKVPAAKNIHSPKPLYRENNWIPMMLGILRSQQVNIGDPDIIRYFVGEPYFDELYDQLTLPEKEKVDAYLKGSR